jgi:hypothetical protein
MNEGIKPNKIWLSLSKFDRPKCKFKKKDKYHIKNTRNIHDLDE